MVFRFLDFELDADLKELRQAGKPCAIEPQVFDLLLYLVENRDRLISHDELIENVWRGRIVADATIASRIRAVRQALGDTGAEQKIVQTQPKRGFRFLAPIEWQEELQKIVSETEDREAPALSAHSGGDQPSIAILPFDNMSGDPDQEFFADGVTEDIITALSKIRWLFVIARNSSFAYKGKANDVKRVSRELGVHYLLEGSTRKAGARVRITAQLVDGWTGSQVWAERYDRELDDIFALQDEITESIVARINTEVRASEMDRARSRPPTSLGAWELYHRGLWHFNRVAPEDNEEARKLFQRAVELDPGFASAYAGIAYTCFVEILHGFGRNADDWLTKGLEACELAIANDDTDNYAHYVLGRILTLSGEGDRAIAELEKSIALSPSFAYGYSGLGSTLNWYGRASDGIPMLEMAMRLSPHDPLLWMMQAFAASCCNNLEHFAEGLDWARGSINERSGQHWPHLNMADALVGLGRLDEAKRSIDEALRVKPDLSLSAVRRLLPHFHPPYLHRHIDALRIAGLPE